MRKVRFILALIVLLSAAFACRKEQEPVDGIAGECSAVFRLSSRDAISLQTKTDADDLLDGLRFKNVLVILVDHSNNVVGNVYKKYPYDPDASGNDPNQEEVTGTSLTDDVIHFEHLNPGNYTAYAYANIDAEAWQKSGEEISASGQEKEMVSGDFSAFLERELKADNPVKPADAGESAMLLTGQTEVLVGLSVETHTIYLKRPVVRLRVYINNTTPYPVRLDDLQFSEFNADRAYLIGRSDENGVPSVPSGVTYGPLPAYPILSSSLETAPEFGASGYEEEYLVYETLLYENAYPDSYKVFATLTLDPTGSKEQQMSLQTKFDLVTYATLSAMDDGEDMFVLVMNPQINVRSGRIFTHISENNYMAWESAGYTNYNDYFNRAKAIYDEESSYDYSSRYSYSKANGYSGWSGLTAVAAKQDATFSYTGVKNTYFHRISKSGGLFTIEGLALQPNNANGVCSGTSITGITVEDGAVVKDKNPADFAGKLVRFKIGSNSYVQADARWDSNPQKESNLKLPSNNATRQDAKFALFGYRFGAPLRRILKENHKEVPLTYMTRNEDIKLVINVFYADQEATLNFDVDNSTWATPSESSHTFK